MHFQCLFLIWLLAGICSKLLMKLPECTVWNLRLFRTRSFSTISSLWLWHRRVSIECDTEIFETISFNLLSFWFAFPFFCCIMLQNNSRHTRNFRTYCARKSYYECKRCAISRAFLCQISWGWLASITAKQRNNRAGSWGRDAAHELLRRIPNANRQSDANNTSAWCCHRSGRWCCYSCCCSCRWAEAELRLGLCLGAVCESRRSTVQPISATTDWHAKWTAARTAARAGQPNGVLCSMCVCVCSSFYALSPRSGGTHKHTHARVINAKTTLFDRRHKNTHGTGNGRA